MNPKSALNLVLAHAGGARDRNPVPWPNGAKCAACFTLDMDAESLLHLAHPQHAHSMVSAASMLRYGPDVAVPRILDTYRHYGIRQTFFVPGWCAERYPYAVEAMVREGHEVSAHGYLHEHPNELSDANEKEWLLRSLSAVRSVTGEKSAGWRAPLYRFSHRSADLLLEAGITYDASLMGDDVPYLIDTPRGTLLELPSHWGMDDWPPFMHSSELEFRDADSIGRPRLGGLVGGIRGDVGIWRPVGSRLASLFVRAPRALAPHACDDR